MSNLKRSNFAESLSEKFYLSKTDSYSIIDTILYSIISELQNGEKVKISGFGTFDVKKKKSRIGRNPKTGEECIISERYVCQFKAIKKVKDRVNNVS